MSDKLKFDLTVDTSQAEKSTAAFVNNVKKRLEGIKVGGGLSGGADPVARTNREIERMNKNVGIGNRFIEQWRVRFDRMGDEAVQSFGHIEQGLRSVVHEMRNMPTGLVRQRLAEISRVDLTPTADGFKGIGNAANKTAAKVGRNWGAVNNRFFQFAQAIEDAQYGLHGAANNMSSLASTISGPAGMLAVGGVLAVTILPQIADALVGVSAAAESTNRHLEATLSRAGDLIGLQDKAFQTQQGIEGKPVKDAYEEREKRMKEADHVREQLRRRESAAGLFDEAASIQKELESARAMEGYIPKDDTDALAERIKQFRGKANRAGILNADEMIYQPSGWGIDKALRGGYGLPSDVLPSNALPQSPDNEVFSKQRAEAEKAADAERARLEGLRIEIRTIDAYLAKAKEKAGVDLAVPGVGASTPTAAMPGASMPGASMPNATTPIGSIGTSPMRQGVSSSSVTNNNSTVYNTSVNGVPTRPSLTLGEVAQAAARQSKAQQQRMGQ